jgi:hypothetical protein
MPPNGSGSYAVITGDIVASSGLSLPDRRRLLRIIGESSRRLRKIFGRVAPLEVDVFRGDSWQLLLTDPPRSLRAALLFRALLRSKMESHQFDTRIAIGIGTVDLVPRRRVSEGSGEAFRASGRALDSMKKRRMAVSFPGSKLEAPLDAIVHLVDEIAVHWTDRQARAMVGALQGWTQKKIARTSHNRRWPPIWRLQGGVRWTGGSTSLSGHSRDDSAVSSGTHCHSQNWL